MTTPIPERQLEVLLAEDNPGDVRLIRDAFSESRVRISLSVAADGEEALVLLRREGKYAGAARVDLVLLDLNMPKMDGRELLTEIRKDPDLDCIPVVILTSSDAEEDVIHSYKLHANAYVSKPNDVDPFTRAVKSIEEFWMRVAKLPPRCHPHG